MNGLKERGERELSRLRDIVKWTEWAEREVRVG